MEENNNNAFDQVDVTGEYEEADIQENKIFAVLAYLGWLWLIPFFAKKDSPFVKFHLNQAIVLVIASIILTVGGGLIRKIPVAGGIVYWVLSVILFVFSIIGLINAATGKAKELPLIGGLKIIN